jgi:molybdopterin converting factor small subunit
MSVQVLIPAPLREHTSGVAKVAVAGDTVQAALADLTTLHPALASKLFDGARVRPYINVFVNEEDIRYLDELGTAVRAGDVIDLIPAVAGG